MNTTARKTTHGPPSPEECIQAVFELTSLRNTTESSEWIVQKQPIHLSRPYKLTDESRRHQVGQFICETIRAHPHIHVMSGTLNRGDILHMIFTRHAMYTTGKHNTQTILDYLCQHLQYIHHPHINLVPLLHEHTAPLEMVYVHYHVGVNGELTTATIDTDPEMALNQVYSHMHAALEQTRGVPWIIRLDELLQRGGHWVRALRQDEDVGDKLDELEKTIKRVRTMVVRGGLSDEE